MKTDDPEIPEYKTLWMYFREGLARANAERPVSFYLLLAIPIVLLLGSRMVEVQNAPKQFAFYLAVFFVFFLVLVQRALIDFIEIVRHQYKEHKHIFRSTLGDTDFTARLGGRAVENEDK